MKAKNEELEVNSFFSNKIWIANTLRTVTFGGTVRGSKHQRTHSESVSQSASHTMNNKLREPFRN